MLSAKRYIKWMGHRTARWMLLCVCFCLSFVLQAQRYPFHNLDMEDGLAQNHVTCLAQDSTGNLWAGTSAGLSRYDGKNFTNYTLKDGLRNDAVWAVAADPQNNIWIAGRSGLEEFNGKAVAYFDVPAHTPGPAGNDVQVQTVGDTVWWRAEGAVYYIVNSELKSFATPAHPGSISAMLAEKNGLWIAADSAIFHFDLKKWDTVRFHPLTGPGQAAVRKIFRAHNNTIWVAGDKGLYKMDNGTLARVSLAADSLTSDIRISSVAEDKAGALWLGVNNGVIKVTGTASQFYNKHSGLSNNVFTGMLADAQGNVWMASDGQGIFRFSGTQFSALDQSMGLPGGQVTAIASNNRDSLFLGTADAGIYIFKEGKATPLPFPSNPPPAVTALYYNGRGKLWIGTHDRGLWSYQRRIFRQYAYPERSNFPSNAITSLYEDTAHRLWIGFANGALVLDQAKFSTVITENTPVSAFLSIGRDSMLIATGKGLMLYYAGFIAPFRTNTVADSALIQCFLLKGRELWMGSSDKGVITYDMDANKASVINKSNGLRSDDIYNITEDDPGNILIGTGYGIHKIVLSDTGAPKIIFYGNTTEMAGVQSCMNAALKLKDGSIWFGISAGALHYQPQMEVASSGPGTIVFQSVKLAGEDAIDAAWYDSVTSWYGIPYHLRLPYNKNNISFTFQAVSPGGTQQLLYRYRMDGLETPWSDWSAITTASYPALPPGKYIFRVQCRGSEVQNNIELDYPFEVIAPFQDTYWFRLSVLIGCMLAGILLHFIYTGKRQSILRRRARLRTEEQNRNRLRAVEDLRDETGNKLTQITVLAGVLKNKITVTPDAERILGQIEESAGQLYKGVEDTVWAMQPANDNVYEILQHIRDAGTELFHGTGTEFTFMGIRDDWHKHRLPADLGRNLVVIFKEALNNSALHAKAKNVWIEATIRNRTVLQLVLRDDGRGFDTDTPRNGNGITNMNTRAAQINGRLYIDAKPGKGTIVSLTFRIPRSRK
jgi:ligand-binding sensor domain-containing protein/signal transduction histidine kinase